MSNWATIENVVELAAAPENVWHAVTNAERIEQWMYPTDFAPEVGRPFTLRPPANPRADFDGTVTGLVLQADPARRLTYTWNGGPVVGTVVRFGIEPTERGARLELEHSGFDLGAEWGEGARSGAEVGWPMMLGKLAEVVAR